MPRGQDLSEPKWWALARSYKAEGWTNKAIGRALGGRSEKAVQKALNPDLDVDKFRKTSRPTQNPNRDVGRMHARAAARKRWRSEGRQGDLDAYYLDSNCM